MKTYLNQAWLFVEGFETSYIKTNPKHAEIVDIPHPARMMDYHNFTAEDYQGIFTYIKEFDAPSEGKVHYLIFEGVMLQFDCYLNGKSLGHFISGYLPVKINISKGLKKTGNRLVIKVDSHEDPSIPPFGKVVDYMTFAGLYRKVYISSHPKEHIEDAFIETDMDGNIDIHLDTVGEASLYFELFDGDKLVLGGTHEHAKLEKPCRWSLNDPHLYHLRMQYGKDIYERDIGFRSIRVAEDGFYLNEERIKLRGLNRHQTYPYVGAAAPDAMQRDDAHILKYELGCNVVRTSHYPQDESFLDECDRIGLLVIDEIPGWQYISNDEIWRENCIDFAKRMIKKERNHPSLIMYGLRIDESIDDHNLYSAIQFEKSLLDPHRPSIGVRYFKDSELLEDVFGYNDFSCNSSSHGLESSASYKKHKGKPKLVTEHNGHMYPTNNADNILRRTEQAMRHLRVMDDAYKDNNLLGAIGWCAFDYNTHKTFGNLDHICYHGVCDIFRNKKFAAYSYASQGDEPVMKVASSLCSSDYDAALIPVTYVLSNLDEIKVKANGVEIGSLKPDKEAFPHLPHPPYKFFDLIGNRFDEPGYSEKEKRQITHALSHVAHFGMDKITLRQALLLGMTSLKHHLSFTDIYQLYGKYISGWGSDGVYYEFYGYKNGAQVAYQKLGPAGGYHIEAKANKDTLVYQDVYDVARVTISCVDDNGNVVHLANDVIEIETKGALRVLGPTKMALVGGSISVYLASKKVEKPCKSKLIVRSARGNIEIPLLVK